MSEFRDWTQRPDTHRRTVQQRIDYIMEENLFRAFEHIWEETHDGKYTRDEAEAALDNWDMSDFFNDWWAKGL